MSLRKELVGIAGMGFYFPKAIVNTREIADEMELPDKVYDNTGICSIYKPDEKDQPSKMAYESARNALEDANISSECVDMIIVSVFKNDYWHWQMSAWLKFKLGAVNAMTLEVKGGCNAHFQAIETAVDQISGSDDIHTVLVVCSERLYGYGWPTFLSSGSQSVVLQHNCEQFRYLGFYTSNFIRYHENAYIPFGGTAYPFDEKTEWKGNSFIENVVVNKDIYFNHIKPCFFKKFQEVTQNLLCQTGHKLSDINYMVTLTQQKSFDERILATLNIPDIPSGKEYKAELGHFSGADSYIILDKARKDGKIKKGDLILSFTIGGVAWSAALIQY